SVISQRPGPRNRTRPPKHKPAITGRIHAPPDRTPARRTHRSPPRPRAGTGQRRAGRTAPPSFARRPHHRRRSVRRGRGRVVSMYRKRPVTVEARRLTTASLFKLARWCGGQPKTSGRIVIPTLEGDMTADPGDWIIKGVQGEFYPCKPGIFAATYEPADGA